MSASSDGVLTATADNARQAIALAVNFQALAVPPPPGTINLLPNPNSEATAALTGALLNVTLAQSATQKRSGSFSSRMTAVAAGTMQATGPNFPVSPNSKLVMSAYARAGTTGRTVTVGIAFYTAALGFISILGAGTVADTNAAFSRASSPVTVPSNAYIAAVYVQVASAALGEIHYIDDIQVEPGTAATDYCDGSLFGCMWSGAANASVSYRPNYNRLTIYRNGTTMVRGSDQAWAPNGQNTKGWDGECARGVAVAYTAALTNGIGTYYSTNATETITSDLRAWLKHPTIPALSRALSVDKYPDWDYGVSQSVEGLLGAYYPLVASDVLQAPHGTLAVVTRDAATRDALLATLKAGANFLLQPSLQAEEPDCYIARGGVHTSRPYSMSLLSKRAQAIDVQQIDRPATTGVAVAYPGRTYADSTATYTTYSAWVASGLTYGAS